MLIYTAGPYSSDDVKQHDAFIRHAREVSIKLWEKGHTVICPHLNTQYFEVDCAATYEDYMRGDFTMISRCDAILMLRGWENSSGSVRELDYARHLGLFVYFEDQGLPDLYPTEISSPVQCKAFWEILGQMGRTHMSKNADYSPANIAGPGMLGIGTRIWDKVIRLMNLTGFRVELASNDIPQGIWERFWFWVQGRVVVVRDVVYTGKEKKAKHESIGDTFLDLAVYGIIGLLYLAGKWGH